MAQPRQAASSKPTPVKEPDNNHHPLRESAHRLLAQATVVSSSKQTARRVMVSKNNRGPAAVSKQTQAPGRVSRAHARLHLRHLQELMLPAARQLTDPDLDLEP